MEMFTLNLNNIEFEFEKEKVNSSLPVPGNLKYLRRNKQGRELKKDFTRVRMIPLISRTDISAFLHSPCSQIMALTRSFEGWQACSHENWC